MQPAATAVTPVPFWQRVLLIAGMLVLMLAAGIDTDIAWMHMLLMGGAMVLAVAVPYYFSRYVWRDGSIQFPITQHTWSHRQTGYIVFSIVAAYFLLPYYLGSTGVYQNWPNPQGLEETIRLFIGTNVLGLWDELFFVCTVLALLRQHLPFWAANLAQAALFTLFLHELGFQSWGFVAIFPFTLLQGYLFSQTKSLLYVLIIHLSIDLLLFVALIHLHNPGKWDIFLT